VLVGSSQGGRIALEVARHDADLLRGVVVSEPPLFSIDRAAGETLLRELIPPVEAALARGGPGRAVETFFSIVCPSYWAQADDTDKARFIANADIGLTDLRSPGLDVAPADLASVDVPMLVVSGETSHPSMRSIARKLAAALPDARFVELEGTGHVTYAENPADFANALSTFAAELEHSATKVPQP
jgi:pimeloyl-ACP methyl ester carboxylesterase